MSNAKSVHSIIHSLECVQEYEVEGDDGQGREDWCGRHRPLPPSHDVASMCQQMMLTLGRVSATNEALVTRVDNLEHQGNESHPPLLSSNQRTIGWTRSAVDTDLLPNSAVRKERGLRMGAKPAAIRTSSTACTASMTL